MKSFLVVCAVLSAVVVASGFGLGKLSMSKQIAKLVGVEFERSELDIDWNRSSPITDEQKECIKRDAASVLEEYQLQEWFENLRIMLKGQEERLRKINESSGIKKMGKLAAFKMGSVKDFTVQLASFPKDKKGAITPVAQIIVECLKKPEFKLNSVSGSF